jgi:CspA family cold shock protein
MSEIKMDGFKTLKEGATVDYEEGSSDKGPCATNVVPK